MGGYDFLKCKGLFVGIAIKTAVLALRDMIKKRKKRTKLKSEINVNF